jgi:hypothetical protein
MFAEFPYDLLRNTLAVVPNCENDLFGTGSEFHVDRWTMGISVYVGKTLLQNPEQGKFHSRWQPRHIGRQL